MILFYQMLPQHIKEEKIILFQSYFSPEIYIYKFEFTFINIEKLMELRIEGRYIMEIESTET